MSGITYGGHELFVFATSHHAANAGFRECKHPTYPQLRAWWPGLGVEALRGMEYGRVTISEGVHRWAFGSAARERELGGAAAISSGPG